MKRIFATALLGTSMFGAVANAEEGPQISLEGRMDIIASYVNQKGTFRQTNPSDSTSAKLHTSSIVNDTKVDIKADGKNQAHGFKYGGMIRLNADSSKATSQEVHLGDKTMVYFESDKVGRIEAGNTPGAGGLLEMEIITLNRGSWGVDGFWSQFVTDKTLRTTGILGGAVKDRNTRSLEFIVSPNLPSNYSGWYYSDAPKINFFTKPMKELTIGITYIDDLDNAGTIAGVATRSGSPVSDSSRTSLPATAKEIVSGGFSYENAIGEMKYKVNVVGEKGRAKQSSVNDLEAYEAGFMASYCNFNLGGSYGKWGKSFTLRNPAADSKRTGEYYTATVSHDVGKLGYSVSYMNSRRAGGIDSLVQKSGGTVSAALIADKANNKFQNIVFDVQYQLAEGFMPYFTVSSFEFKESTGGRDKGEVVLAGTRLLF